MPQDAYTLRYLCEEIKVLFKGGKINRITQPSADATVFTVYTAVGVKRLCIDTNPALPRIGVSDAEERGADKTPGNFCMLMRKHLISATIEDVSLVGFDRIVKIDLTPTAQFFDATPKTIYAELMGRYSNLILTSEGKVIGANRGINFLDNNVRPLISGHTYRLPPAGEKREPNDPALKEIFKTEADITADKISGNVSGIAQSTAKEIAARFFSTENAQRRNDASDGDISEKFIGFLRSFIYFSTKKPCIIRENGALKDVLVYPYDTVTGEREFFDDLYLAEEKYFSEKATAKKFAELKTRLTSITNTALKKAKKRLSAVNVRLADALTAEEDRIKGELIIANIYRIKTGDEIAVLDNYYYGTKTEIPLDKTLSPSKNAEVYYKRYNKKKRATELLAPQKTGAEEEIAYLESVLTEIGLADGVDDLAAVKEELSACGLIVQKGRGAKKEDVLAPRVYDFLGFTVKVGRNNAENDRLTFSARGYDIWLHAKDYHSSHVIIETAGKEVPKKVVELAAEVCAYYSKGRNGGKTEIVYCEKKYVKKPKGAKLGFCTYDNYKSLTVEPYIHAEDLKK